MNKKNLANFSVFLVLFLSIPKYFWLDWLGTWNWLLSDWVISTLFPPAHLTRLPHLLPKEETSKVSLGFSPNLSLLFFAFCFLWEQSSVYLYITDYI